MCFRTSGDSLHRCMVLSFTKSPTYLEVRNNSQEGSFMCWIYFFNWNIIYIWIVYTCKLGHYLKKPRRYHGECCAYGGPKAKTWGAAGPKGFGRGTSRGTTFTMIPPRFFSKNVILIESRTSKEGFLSGWVWLMDSLGSPLDIIPGLDSEYW